MAPNTPRPRFRLAVASIVTASVLAACGSSDGDDAGGAAAATTEAIAETTATTEAMTDDSMVDDMADDDMTDDSMVDDMADDDMTDDSMVDDMADEMTDDSMADDMADDEMADDMVLPPWQTIALTDVDGVSFTLHDFSGKPVFVETFATWCPNCREQLQATNAAAEQLGDQAVFVALSVETNLSAGDVAEYAADNGFDAVRFAVMTPEALAAFVDGLGQSAANPPSTPKVVIDAMGTAGELTTGFESADEIVAQVTGQG